jgi:hypothetical protein
VVREETAVGLLFEIIFTTPIRSRGFNIRGFADPGPRWVAPFAFARTKEKTGRGEAPGLSACRRCRQLFLLPVLVMIIRAAIRVEMASSMASSVSLLALGLR